MNYDELLIKIKEVHDIVDKLCDEADNGQNIPQEVVFALHRAEGLLCW